jgi:methionine-rich copper-binding protein CopC
MRRGGKLLTPTASGLKPGDRRVVRAAFSKALAAASYSVAWRATSGDGHRQEGSWSFVIVR